MRKIMYLYCFHYLFIMLNIKRYQQIIQQLSLRQCFAVMVAACRLTVLTIVLRFKPFDWCWQQLSGVQPNAKQTSLDKDPHAFIFQAEQLHENVRLASRLLPFSCECLPRSIVLRDMLQRKGIDAFIRLGVNKSAATMNSHAWVEVAGQAIGEKADLAQSFTKVRTGSESKDS